MNIALTAFIAGYVPQYFYLWHTAVSQAASRTFNCNKESQSGLLQHHTRVGVVLSPRISFRGGGGGGGRILPQP